MNMFANKLSRFALFAMVAIALIRLPLLEMSRRVPLDSYENGVVLMPQNNLSATIQNGESRPFVAALLAHGFHNSEAVWLVKMSIPLKDLCVLLDCKPRDFGGAATVAGPVCPLGDINAPNALYLYRPSFICKVWLLDPFNPPTNIDDASVQVAFLSMGAPVP